MRALILPSKYSVLLRLAAVLVAVVVVNPPAAAEELVLKNGQKIVGTIVGYENDLFRVETEYGFALVRKDRVESINFAVSAKREAAKQATGAGTGSRGERSEKRPSATVGDAAAGATLPSEKSEKASRTTAALTASDAASGGAAQSAKPASEAAKLTATAPPPSRPMDEPLPSNLHEHVDGTTYINDSFHFALFKPPGWKVYEEVPKETGSAIMAIGTEDEETLLFIDRQVWSGTPDVKSDQAEAKLRATYQEYQKLLESPVQIDGEPAIRRVFKGVIDGVEWHGVSVHMARGNTVFGIIGLTSAETFQFQQALFNKIISSFHFLAPASTASASPSVLRR